VITEGFIFRDDSPSPTGTTAPEAELSGAGRVRVFVHKWLHVRSLYFPDPEGNLLEFVCYDASAG